MDVNFKKNKIIIMITKKLVWIPILFIAITVSAQSKLDVELVKKLEEIQRSDQENREKLIDILEKEGKDSKKFKELNKKIKVIDSSNMVQVAKILDERGWLGEDVVGKQGNITLFLVVQHANLETQKKYLPMLKDAVKKGNAKPSFLAMLTDRVAMLDGKKQIYGSQLNTNEKTGELYVHPIEDPDNVDKRRAEVGLGKLSDYLAMYGLKWDISEHKKLNMN
ncbi:DUF6624 domain-containing protein [Winogradskyella flava]|uniref:DUF6624 domain-containing protein n=1 Tax=Winogradskyella flava TaxID=1884876 RepID=UPI002490D67E|nr:DUF6624 domain-containing protein [Winogradskyella flava]